MKIKNKMIIVLLLFLGAIVQESQAQEIWTLDKCIETAVQNNKKLLLEKNNIEIGKEKKSQVKANYLPKIKIEADYKYFIELPYQLMPMSVFGGPEGQFKEAQFGVPHNINANLQFALPLYNPQIKSNVEMAKIGIEIAQLKYQKSEEKLFFDIASLYYNAQILLSQMDFVDSNIDNSNKLHKNVKLLNKHQLAMSTDVDKVSLQMLQLQTKKGVIKNKYDQVMNALKILMGLPMDQQISIETNITFKEQLGYSVKPTLDVKLVETKDKLLKRQLETIKKSQLPSVMLYGSFGAVGYGYDKSPNEFLNFYSMGFAGIKASYNLFDGKITKKKKNIKKREIENNALQLEMLKDQNNLKVKNAELKIAMSLRTIKTTQSQIDFANSIYNKTLIQQKEGMASINDILMADNTLKQAQQDYISSIIEYIKSDLELKYLSGNIIK